MIELVLIDILVLVYFLSSRTEIQKDVWHSGCEAQTNLVLFLDGHTVQIFISWKYEPLHTKKHLSLASSRLVEQSGAAKFARDSWLAMFE